jgi:hypothetical protein
MNYYERFSPEAISAIKSINDKLMEEEKKEVPDKNKILKMKQQILMKGLEMSVGFDIQNYNPYR